MLQIDERNRQYFDNIVLDGVYSLADMIFIINICHDECIKWEASCMMDEDDSSFLDEIYIAIHPSSYEEYLYITLRLRANNFTFECSYE